MPVSKRYPHLLVTEHGRTCSTCFLFKSWIHFNKKGCSSTGHRSTCKSCQAKAKVIYDENHKEAKRKYGHDYYQKNKARCKAYAYENKEKIRKRTKKWAERNREILREKNRKYYLENKETIRVKSREYATKNKELLAEYQRYYIKSPKGIQRRKIAAHKRRTKEILLKPLKEEHLLVLETFNKIYFSSLHFTCEYCQKPIINETYHLDHIHPISKGGDNQLENLAISCSMCNKSKKAKLLVDFQADKVAYFTNRFKYLHWIL